MLGHPSGSGRVLCAAFPLLLADSVSAVNLIGCHAMKTCDKCQGSMLIERAVDLNAGLAITVFACLNCGRRQAAEREPRPITARH